jgi:hypothetical protein
MKKLLCIIVIFTITQVNAQPYFSKMFDVNGQWENFWGVLDTVNNSFKLIGSQASFLTTDSTRFGSIFIGNLDSSLKFQQNLLIAKNYYEQNYLSSFKNNNRNFLLMGTVDTNVIGSYILNELDNNFDNVIWSKTLAIPSEFGSTSWTKVKDKVYLFGRNGNYALSSMPGFYVINLKDTSTKYYRIGGTGKIINNVVLTQDGNFIVSGIQYMGINGSDSTFGWYAKIDTLGNTLWNKVLDRNSKLMCEYVWGTSANGNYYLTGTNYANYPTLWYPKVYGDTSFCYMLKINEQNGGIEWQKRFLYSVNKERGLLTSMGSMTYYKSNLYSLLSHNLTSTNNQYIMFAKFDLDGNILWKRLFQQANYNNRSYSLTPVADGFLICADGKDSTRAKGDADAWLIKTDTNGCIIPGCNAKDNVVQIINPEKVFTVYPNPAQNEINVEINFDRLNYQNIESLAIYNMQGQLLKFRQAQLPEKEITKINTEDLANGNYLLIITTDKKQMAGKKFVVER